MVGIALLSIVLIAATAVLILRALAIPRARAARVLEQIGAYGFTDTELAVLPDEEKPGLVERVGGAVAPLLGRERLAAVRRMLIGAGLHGTSVERYLGWSAISLVAIPLLLLYLTASSKTDPAIAIMEIIIGVVAGGLLPHAILNRRARQRSSQIDYEMPELVDLLLVAVEGGMGFNGAVRAAAHRVEGPLGEELLLMMQQQQLGASTSEALQNMLARCDTAAVQAFVGTIVQGEKLGVSIGSLMRTLAEDMRKKRTATAEEKARKVPIKILFPLVFAILPAMLIVVMTPAIANIVNALSSI